MKESFWGIMIFMFGVIAILLVFFFQSMTNTSEHNYVLLKEATEGAMIDAVDLAHYRDTGSIRIDQEKFVENFIRRFAQSAQLSRTYIVEIYDVNEEPPKVSLAISSAEKTSASGEILNFTLMDRLDAILEVPKNACGFNSSVTSSEGQTIYMPSQGGGNTSSGSPSGSSGGSSGSTSNNEQDRYTINNNIQLQSSWTIDKAQWNKDSSSFTKSTPSTVNNSDGTKTICVNECYKYDTVSKSCVAYLCAKYKYVKSLQTTDTWVPIPPNGYRVDSSYGTNGIKSESTDMSKSNRTGASPLYECRCASSTLGKCTSFNCARYLKNS